MSERIALHQAGVRRGLPAALALGGWHLRCTLQGGRAKWENLAPTWFIPVLPLSAPMRTGFAHCREQRAQGRLQACRHVLRVAASDDLMMKMMEWWCMACWCMCMQIICSKFLLCLQPNRTGTARQAMCRFVMCYLVEGSVG